MTKRQQLSIVIPVHNEAKNIPILYQALCAIAKKVPYILELIFVDDGSNDTSLAVLEALAQEDRRVRLIEFARNFGKEAAVSAGLHAARGGAVVMIDADMQHPPSLIFKMLKRWQEGADVVVGVREYDQTEGALKKFFSWLFYRLMGVCGVKQITPRATDFRLVDRKVADVFKGLTERNRMTRSLLDWLGFRRKYVYFTAPPRANGVASYSFKQLIGLAINSFTSHSLLPLRFAGYLGVFILFGSGLLGVFMYFTKYIWGDPYHFNFTGTAMLATLVVFLVGLVLVCLGLVAMYIARIHSEVANRPLYVIRRDSLSDLEGGEA